MLFVFSIPGLIRHLWQLKTVVFLHWYLICTLLLACTLLSQQHLSQKICQCLNRSIFEFVTMLKIIFPPGFIGQGVSMKILLFGQVAPKYVLKNNWVWQIWKFNQLLLVWLFQIGVTDNINYHWCTHLCTSWILCFIYMFKTTRRLSPIVYHIPLKPSKGFSGYWKLKLLQLFI